MTKLMKFLIAAVTVTGFSIGVAQAQYPNKPIEIIVGYSAGGGTDVMARTLAPYLEKYLGHGARVVVKNKPGAGGQIGFTETALAKPDGYTLGTFNLPAAMAHTFDRHTNYSLKSYTFLANIVEDPNTLVVQKKSSIHTVADLIKKAKADKSKMTVGLAALGGNDEFSALEFAKAAGVTFSMVPFKGASQSREALMGGHVQLATFALSQAVNFTNSLRVLTVFSDKRSSFAPNVPTAKSLGYDIQMGSFRGIVAPAGLPKRIRTKLMAAIIKANHDPAFLKAMAKQGNALHLVTGKAYRALAKKQTEVAGQIWKTTPWKE